MAIMNIVTQLPSDQLNTLLEAARYLEETIQMYKSEPWWEDSSETWDAVITNYFDTRNDDSSEEITTLISEYVYELRDTLSDLKYFDNRKTPKTRQKLISDLLEKARIIVSILDDRNKKVESFIDMISSKIEGKKHLEDFTMSEIQSIRQIVTDYESFVKDTSCIDTLTENFEIQFKVKSYSLFDFNSLDIRNLGRGWIERDMMSLIMSDYVMIKDSNNMSNNPHIEVTLKTFPEANTFRSLRNNWIISNNPILDAYIPIEVVMQSDFMQKISMISQQIGTDIKVKPPVNTLEKELLYADITSRKVND